MRKNLSFVLLICLLLGVTNVAAQEETFTPVFVPTDCTMPIPSGYTDGENLICGYVEVPEFHNNPTGNTLRLSVTVIKTAGSAPDPLVMFTGGPGANILNFLPTMTTNIAAPVTQDRDVVLMSERGSFGAEPLLTCPELDAALAGQFGGDLDELNARKLDAFTACYDRLTSEGINLSAYNNPERAADVPLVMQALGYAEYNLWGVSGGGIMAQYVLRDHPEGVRTLMTDSGAFPTAYIGTVFFNIYDIVSHAYRTLFETCAADAACNENYPDLENVYWGVIKQLNAEPAPVQITDPATGETVDWLLTGDVVVSILANEFANVEILPQVMYNLAAGDYSYVLERVPGLYQLDAEYSDGLYESVVCSEVSELTQETASTANAYPQVVQALYDQIQFNIDLCGQWQVDPVAEGPVITSDTPILIMEGKFDSNKPPQLGAEVAANFSTSYLVEFADTAHGVFSGCTLRMMGEFMNDPTTAPDTSCVATETVFALPGGGALTFSTKTIESLGVQVAIPDGWAEADAGLYVNPLDGTLLLITALPGDDIDAAMITLADGAGLPPLTKLGDVPVGERTWAIYQVIDGETGTMAAAFSEGGTVYITGLQTTAATLENATDTILRPVAESLVIME